MLEKHIPFFRGRELLDPASFAEILHPSSGSLPSTSDSPLQYHSADSLTPGYPINPRMQLARLYLQLGIFLDYYTGQHSPSLSEELKNPLNSEQSLETLAIFKHHISLFPQLNITPSFPRTFLIHGELDSAVPIQESLHLKTLLQANSVYFVMKVVEGQGHSFDYEPGAEARHGQLFNELFDFIASCLPGQSCSFPNPHIP